MHSFKKHYLLSEGGVYGHMNYVYERLDFTFIELKDFFHNLITGRVDRVTEKVDGQNIFFTWNNIAQEPRFARNVGQIKKGGITLKALREQFAGRSTVEKIFADGGTQIYSALQRLSSEKRREIFGNRGDLWVNAEIMHTIAPNVILYKGNHIVLHGMYAFDNDGTKHSLPNETFLQLTQELRAEVSNWRILGPIVHKITNFEGLKGPYDKFTSAIDDLISKAGLDNHSTIGDFIEKKVYEELIQAGMPDDAAGTASKVVVGKENVNLNDFKKYVGPTLKPLVSKYLTQTEIRKTHARITEPIQRAVTDLSIVVLKDLTSILVLDSKKEAQRITKRVSDLIGKIHQYQDEYTQNRKDFLAREIAKHSNSIDTLLQNFQSPIEGLVVEYPPGSGNLLKITGAFGTINQILGLGQYGRGDIPPLESR
jgi:hypothetical protein